MKTSTRLRLYQIFGYITAPPREVLFSSGQQPLKRLLFLFPLQDEWLLQSTYVYHRLAGHLANNSIYLAVAQPYREVIAGPTRSIFYFPTSPSTPLKIQMAVMMARFRKQAFDAVLNLEPELNFQIARVMSAIKAPWRIGFAGPEADNLYNIQVHADLSRGLEGAYEQMLTLCNIDAVDKPKRTKSKKINIKDK